MKCQQHRRSLDWLVLLLRLGRLLHVVLLVVLLHVVLLVVPRVHARLRRLLHNIESGIAFHQRTECDDAGWRHNLEDMHCERHVQY